MFGVMIASTLLAALFKVFAFQEAIIVIIFLLAVLVVTVDVGLGNMAQGDHGILRSEFFFLIPL